MEQQLWLAPLCIVSFQYWRGWVGWGANIHPVEWTENVEIGSGTKKCLFLRFVSRNENGNDKCSQVTSKKTKNKQTKNKLANNKKQMTNL